MGINGFYSIEIVSILPTWVFLSIQKIKNIHIQKYICILICTITLVVTMIKLNTRDRGWFAKYKEKIYDIKFYKPPFDVKKVKKQLSLIPGNANVAATDRLVSHLS